MINFADKRSNFRWTRCQVPYPNNFREISLTALVQGGLLPGANNLPSDWSASGRPAAETANIFGERPPCK